MAPPPHSQVGSGKVTDSQVAFMVECYLRDSRFSRTLQEFRLEAARLLHPLRSVPKGARSLSAVLNDYVALKEEQISAAAEKARVEDLFHGLQEILSVYLSGVPKPIGETRIETLSPSPPPPPFASPVGTQQPQVHVSYESEAAAPPCTVATSTMDQPAKKASSQKRKSQGKNNGEPLQHGDSYVDLVKKPRRGSNVKQLSSDPPPVGGSVIVVDSNLCAVSTDCLGSNRTVQPATPPMNTVSCKPQQQAIPGGAMSESRQPSPSPTKAAESLVSPKHPSITSSPPPSTMSDVLQCHQDPQTPSPSSTKSSLNASSSTCASSREKEAFNAAAPTGKTDNVQQQRRAPGPHFPPATSHYALRAHKKLSEASCTSLSDTQSKCALKPTRKRAINSKCRLLDFSAAVANTGHQVDAMLKESKETSCISASSYANQSAFSSDLKQIIESPAASHCNQESDLDSSEIIPQQELDATVFPMPCDAFSFDELFNLDLDTSLISELEDLAEITGCATDPSCSEIAALSCPPEPSSGRVLLEIDNLIHSEETAVLTPRAACSSVSLKQRKPATMGGNESSLDDKENIHALVVSQ